MLATMRPAWLQVLPAVLGMAGACHLAIGIDEYTESTPIATTSTGGGGAGGEMSVGGGGAGGSADCMPPIPPGWTGPAVLYEGTDAPPSCAADVGLWRDPITGGNDVVEPDCTCGCTVESSSLMVESACRRLFDVSTGNGCNSLVLTGIDPDSCQVLPNPTNLQATPVDPMGFAPASNICAAGTENMPTATFGTQTQVCVSSLPPGDDAVCTTPPPPGYGDQLCIYRTEHVGCPADFPDTRHTFFADIDDDRDCACACSSDTLQCTFVADLHKPTVCTTTPGLTVSVNGSCQPFGADGYSRVLIRHTGVSGTCNDTPTITGDAVAEQPYTVCCKER